MLPVMMKILLPGTKFNEDTVSKALYRSYFPIESDGEKRENFFGSLQFTYGD